MFNRFRLWLRRWSKPAGDEIHEFEEHPLREIWEAIKQTGRRLWAGIRGVGSLVLFILRMIPGRVYLWTAAALAIVLCLVVAGYALVFSYIERQIPRTETIDDYVYLDQGWGRAANSADRVGYYYTPQGAYLKDIRYDWFTALERPWKKDRFVSPQYMRAYGFIVDPTEIDKNPGRLPIGLAQIWDPRTATMLVDITCATCHTAELQFVKDGRRKAVRIDGGPAMHDLTSGTPGHFAGDLAASLVSTYFNPFKWRRFRNQVLRDGDPAKASQLRQDYWKVMTGILGQAFSDSRRHLYVDEGYGRTDAVGRIANNVFGTNLDPRNYHVANAPVSYPPLWDIWKFDWVQYAASVKQPMARNIGETMGTGARYFLLDAYGRHLPPNERYVASTNVPNLSRIENSLHKLQPPAWPADVFGPIDMDKAAKGKVLFGEICQKCHGPFLATCAEKQIDAPMKQGVRDHWKVHAVSVQDIGTDPTAALNWIRNRFDLSLTGLRADEVRNTLRPYYLEEYRRLVLYSESKQYSDIRQMLQKLDPEERVKKEEDDAEEYVQEQLGQIDLSSVSEGAGLNYLVALIRNQAYQDMDLEYQYQREERDGYGQLDLPQVAAQYKARPLAGVWATGPYLHNGSVPNLYEMLVPAYQRSKKFWVKSRNFDPQRVGLSTDPSEPGAFQFDTTVTGNSNGGHEFRAGYRPWKEGDPPSYGVIGRELKEDERWAIIEYLKVHREEDFLPDPAAEEKCGPPGEFQQFEALKAVAKTISERKNWSGEELKK